MSDNVKEKKEAKDVKQVRPGRPDGITEGESSDNRANIQNKNTENKNREEKEKGTKENNKKEKDEKETDTSKKSIDEKSKDEDEGNDGKYVENYAVIPPNGGWGWMVVATAFYCNVVTDGIQFTYGVFMESISKSLNAEYSKVALAGSLMFGIHLLMGPVCSGVTTVFGLRLVTIVGALLCAVGVALAYFATNFWVLCLTYGLMGGMGLGLVYMNSLLITGLYFTTLMPVAVGIVVCGTGVGTMIFAALGHFLLQITTWQNTMLINSALSASMAVAALAFKPLKPIRVKITQSSTSNMSSKSKAASSTSSVKTKSIFIKKQVPLRQSITSTKTIQSYVWNALLQDTVLQDIARTEQGKCKCKCWKCSKCCKRKKKKKEEEVLVLAEIKDDIVRPDLIDRRRSYVEKQADFDTVSRTSSTMTVATFQDKKKKKSVYERVEYKKKAKTNFCTQLRQSVLATIDCHLLASCAFFLFTLSGALQMSALLVVYIYEKDRCKDLGFTEDMSVYFVMTLGGANTFWRLFLGIIAIIPKINPHIVTIAGITIGGIATMLSGLSTDVYYQFAFCFFYSLGMASFAVFRIVLLLDLVKPEESANATGINLLFMGVFSIIAPPLFGWAMELTKSYDVIFLSAGFIIIASAILLIGLKKLRKKELEKLNDHS